MSGDETPLAETHRLVCECQERVAQHERRLVFMGWPDKARDLDADLILLRGHYSALTTLLALMGMLEDEHARAIRGG